MTTLYMFIGAGPAGEHIVCRNLSCNSPVSPDVIYHTCQVPIRHHYVMVIHATNYYHYVINEVIS